MKREILREEEHEDGSFTRVEKFTQTPEDGFVDNKVHSQFHLEQDGGMFDKGKFKGHRVNISYQTTNPKVVRTVFFVVYGLIALLVVGIFLALIFTQEDPGAANEYKRNFLWAIVALVLVLVIAITEFRDQDKLRGEGTKRKRRPKN